MTTQLATNVVARHIESRSPRRKEQDAVMAFLIEKGMVEVSVGRRGMTLTVFGGTEAEINRNIRLPVVTYATDLFTLGYVQSPPADRRLVQSTASPLTIN